MTARMAGITATVRRRRYPRPHVTDLWRYAVAGHFGTVPKRGQRARHRSAKDHQDTVGISTEMETGLGANKLPFARPMMFRRMRDGAFDIGE